MKTTPAIDVGALIDGGRWTGYQKLLIFATALTIILDGVDNQLMGPSIPALMKDWNLPREAFVHVLTAGPFGMLFGGLLGGFFGDRIGRRNALLSSVIVFATLTLGISFVGDPETLAILRFLAGLGLGGAMPNAAVLASEYVPQRRRALAVAVTIVCVPLGGSIASQTASYIIGDYGWQSLWRLGGILPIVLGIVLFRVLPESPKYLARHPARWPELRTLLGRMGHEVPQDAVFAAQGGGGVSAGSYTGSYRDLFSSDRLRDTFGLWIGFFFCLMGNYIAIQWMPTLLSSESVGFKLSTANQILTAFNIGGIFGAVIAATVAQRFGSRGSILIMTAASVGGAVGLSFMTVDGSASSHAGLYAMIIFTGGLMNTVQTMMYALAAHVYPTEIRGRGVGTAVAVGRIGHALTGELGPFTMGGGTAFYFRTWAFAMVVVFVAMAIVKRHIGANARVAAGH